MKNVEDVKRLIELVNKYSALSCCFGPTLCDMCFLLQMVEGLQKRTKSADNILAAVKVRAPKLLEDWPLLEQLLSTYEKKYGKVKHG